MVICVKCSCKGVIGECMWLDTLSLVVVKQLVMNSHGIRIWLVDLAGADTGFRKGGGGV